MEELPRPAGQEPEQGVDRGQATDAVLVLLPEGLLEECLRVPRRHRREQRAAIVGDADFLSNQFLGNGGNRELGQRLFNWLLADDALIEIADRGPRDRLIALSQTRLSVTAIGFLVVIPLGLVLTGSLLVWRRRRR